MRTPRLHAGAGWLAACAQQRPGDGPSEDPGARWRPSDALAYSRARRHDAWGAFHAVSGAALETVYSASAACD